MVEQCPSKANTVEQLIDSKNNPAIAHSSHIVFFLRFLSHLAGALSNTCVRSIPKHFHHSGPYQPFLDSRELYSMQFSAEHVLFCPFLSSLANQIFVQCTCMCPFKAFSPFSDDFILAPRRGILPSGERSHGSQPNMSFSPALEPFSKCLVQRICMCPISVFPPFSTNFNIGSLSGLFFPPLRYSIWFSAQRVFFSRSWAV